jgi:hypothetical protein
LLVQVRDCLRLAWVSEEDPGKGLQYIYLSEPDYQRLAKSVRADLLVLPCGERRWVVSDIIGQEDGLGVENLSGSAAIGTLFCRYVNHCFMLHSQPLGRACDSACDGDVAEENKSGHSWVWLTHLDGHALLVRCCCVVYAADHVLPCCCVDQGLA